MTRPRIMLMLAWGLLAAGSAIQFIEASGDDGDPEAETAPVLGPVADTSEATPIPDRLADRGQGGQTEEAGVSPVGHLGVDDVLLVDDPASWAAALPAEPALVATVIGDGVASTPDSGSGPPTHWFPNPTQFGGARTFLVVDATSSDDHVKVSLPVMPNGQEGWIPRSAVELSTVTHRAEVDLSAATVTVWDGDELILTTQAVTGRVSAPTPVGRFYVRDIIAQSNPDGDYGPWVLALSGFSEVLATFGGGLPALALHGTDEPAEIGSAISSGCLRVPNEVITTLAEIVPLGTPVTIVA